MRHGSTTKTIPVEQHAALFSLINESRALNGWSGLAVKDADPVIRIWAAQLNRHEIPISAYKELLNRSVDLRARRLSDGKEPPAMNAELLIAHWTGQNGLKAELKQRQIDSGRVLGAGCEICHGTGWKVVEKGDTTAYAPCRH